MPTEDKIKKNIFSHEDSDWRNSNLTMEQRLKDGLIVNQITGGPLGTDVPEPRLHYIRARNEKVIKKKNAYITFGTDRPDGVGSGFGGKGAQRANRIDIVVGRMSSKKQDRGTHVNNCFSADAARIYLSQCTDIDLNFGIVDGATAPKLTPDGEVSGVKGLSGIGIKADAVRVVGREGVKIVTGKGDGFRGYGAKGETNSRGGKLGKGAPPIELIAGNYDGSSETMKFEMTGLPTTESIPNLQGIAMGELTADSLLELSEIIDDMWSVIYGFAIEQMTFNAIVGSACAGAATSPASNAALFPIGAYTPKNVAMKTRFIGAAWSNRAKKMMWERYYLKPYGYKYIVSRNVFST